MHRFRPLAARPLLVLFVALAVAAPGAQAQEPSLGTDEERTFYALGAEMGRQLVVLGLSPAELAAFMSGVETAAKGEELALDPAAYAQKIVAVRTARLQAAAATERAAARAFLDQAAAEKGARKTESGLVYTVVKEGGGPAPAATSVVRVHYHGTLRDGKVFDSSRVRGEPAVFPLNRVIPCWTEGVQRMKTGGQSVLVCPSELAYGDQGFPPNIPPGAALRFEVELIAIER